MGTTKMHLGAYSNVKHEKQLFCRTRLSAPHQSGTRGSARRNRSLELAQRRRLIRRQTSPVTGVLRPRCFPGLGLLLGSEPGGAMRRHWDSTRFSITSGRSGRGPFVISARI